MSNMTKRTRSLLVAVIALVAVVGLLVGLLLLLPDGETPDDNGTTPTVDESVTLLDKSGDTKITVSSVTVTAQGKSHTIVKTDDALYTVKGYEDLPLDLYALQDVTDALLTVEAIRPVVDAPQNPVDFGFDKADGDTVISVAYSDNTTFSFEIGDVAPSGEGCYLRESGKSAVYLADTTFCEMVATPAELYIDLAPITAPEAVESTDTVVVRDVTLTGTVRPQSIFFHVVGQQPDGEDAIALSGYTIQRPYFHAVDVNSPLLSYTNFTGLTASGFAKLRPTKADLAAYGLSNPYSVCTVNLALQRTTEKTNDTGETVSEISYHSTFEHTIKLGKKDKDGNYYGVIYAENDMFPVVYLFSSTAVSSFATAQYEDVADDMLYFEYITNLSSLSITNEGDTKTFSFKHYPNEEDSTKSLLVTAGDATYSTPDFRTLYASLLSLYRSGVTDAKPSGTPLMTVVFTPLKQHGEATRIQIYEYDAGYCLVTHSTGEKHLLRAKDVQAFQTTYRKFLAGEALPY